MNESVSNFRRDLVPLETPAAPRRRLSWAALCGLAVAGLCASVASASPPSMTAITLPVNGPSIVTAIVGIGAIVMLLWVGPKVAFGFVRSLVSRLSKGARG